MKTSLLPLAGFLPAFLVAPLCAEMPGIPVLTTPGTATWSTEITPVGSRTIFKITANSIFEWASGFNLSNNDELVFDFIGGESVVNMLGGNGVNVIGGNVTSNGNVAFFSPTADLVVSGNVTAKSLTIAALDTDPVSFSSGGALAMSGDPAGFNGLFVTGQIRSTGGDIVLAGRGVDIAPGASLNAKGAARIAGGSDIRLEGTGAGRHLKEQSGSGFVLNLGSTRASKIEVAAGDLIMNRGRLDAGKGQIFLEVGNDGKILKDAAGILVGKVSINGKTVKEDAMMPNEGDSASALSPSTLKMPTVKRPDGSTYSNSRTVVSNTPISASADSSRDRKGSAAQVASRDRGPKPMLQRASFFGMRGGSATVKK